MDLFMAISQGIGTSLATGVRALLAPFLVGAFARLNLGVDFEGTAYEFLESIAWLVILLALIVAAWWIERAQISVPDAVWAVIAAAFAGVLFAGCLDEENYAPEPGLFAGAVVALLAFIAARTFLSGAEERLAARGESGARGTLNLMVDTGALLLAALSLLVPPVAYAALAFCLWVLLVRRRRSAQKYEGLRILR